MATATHANRLNGVKGKAKPEETTAPASSIVRIRVGLRGLPPGLLFGGKGLMEEDQGKGGKRTKQRTPEEEAELRAHWMNNGKKRELCIPWIMLYNSVCQAAGTFKFRGQKTMSTVVAATVSCEQDRISLGDATYETYAEWCRIPPKTGAMVKLGRPLIRKWDCSFVLVVDSEMYDANILKEIFAHAGKMVGIGAWRPSLKGPHGKWEVMGFEILE